MDVRDGCGHVRQVGPRQQEVGGVTLGQAAEDVRHHITQQGHDGKVVFDKAKLHIQADIFA